MRLDLDDLAVASREALMVEWREVVGSPTPKHLSKLLMVQILSYTRGSTSLVTQWFNAAWWKNKSGQIYFCRASCRGSISRKPCFIFSFRIQ